MNHLSDDLIHTLAVKVMDEAELSPVEEDALMHITGCDKCYHMLRAMMAMLQVSRNIGAMPVDAEPVEAVLPVRETIRAVLKLAVNSVNTVLDQLADTVNDWTFGTAPALLAGARGAGRRSSSVKKLTDMQNTRNFVAYDPDKKLLMIQLDASGYSASPEAFLTLSDGTEMEISFERRGDIFWAEVTGLEDDDYEITLEK